MKFIREEISSAKKVRYMFALGASEAKVISCLLEKAITYMPRTFRTQHTEARMRNMARVIAKAIPEMGGVNHEDDYSELH